MFYQRQTATILALSLSAAFSLSSCGESEIATSATTEWTISEKPMTLTFFHQASTTYNEAMPIWKKAAELTNITLRNVASESASDSNLAFNTMLVSGKLPDIIWSERSRLMTIASQGALVPLDDLINEYAPDIQAFHRDYPEAIRASTGVDEQIYCITGTIGGSPGTPLPSVGFFIRQDWLDKLGLGQPTTVQEYRNTLMAFRTKDPNGNGEKDEIPYFFRDSGIDALLQLYNAKPSWYVNEKGEVSHGACEEEYRYAMSELSSWFKEGLIDPEIYSRGSQARAQLLGGNTGGSTHDWFSSTAAFNDTYKEIVPELNFVVIPPPADISGNVKEDFSRDSLHNFAWGISKDCKNPVEAIKYMNFWFTKIGSDLQSYGVEGMHYDIQNGEVVFKDEALNFPSGTPNFLKTIGSIEIGKRGDINAEIMAMNEIAKEGFNLYLDNKYCSPPFPVISFNEKEQASLTAHWISASTYIREQQQKWLLGEANVDDTWDKYLAELQNMGMENVIESYNSAYKRYMSN